MNRLDSRWMLVAALVATVGCDYAVQGGGPNGQTLATARVSGREIAFKTVGHGRGGDYFSCTNDAGRAYPCQGSFVGMVFGESDDACPRSNGIRVKAGASALFVSSLVGLRPNDAPPIVYDGHDGGAFERRALMILYQAPEGCDGGVEQFHGSVSLQWKPSGADVGFAFDGSIGSSVTSGAGTAQGCVGSLSYEVECVP